MNALTLWDNALPPEAIPAYPKVRLATARGGEITFYAAQKHKINDARTKVIIGQRPAEPGEFLRDSTLKFIPDWTENRLWRLAISEKCRSDPAFREWQKMLCRSSITYFANTFCYSYDPRLTASSRKTPFVTFEFQDEVLTWMVGLIRNGQVGLVEKSRDMGISWMAVIAGTWLTLFEPETEALFMSMREEDVDDRSMSSLLGKVRYLLASLPEWMRGGWSENGPGDKIMSIAIPGTRSQIKGILSRSTAGRSGRATVCFPDEFAFVEDSESVLQALSELSNAKIYMSTPHGTGNAFHRMASEAHTAKQTLHWSLHPLKNPDWAEWRKGEPDMSEETWAQEQEITYELSVIGRVFPQFITFKTQGVGFVHVSDDDFCTYNPAYPTYSTSDLGVSDPCSTLWAQLKPALPEFKPYTDVSLIFFDEHSLRNMGAADLRWLINSKGYNYREHVIDMRSGGQTDSSNRSWQKNLADPDLKPTYSKAFHQLIHPGPPVIARGYRPLSVSKGKQVGSIDVFRNCLNIPGLLWFQRTACKTAIQSIQNWSFPLDKETRKPLVGSEPNHDQWSHFCKAAIYLTCWVFARPAGKASGQQEWSFPAFKLNLR